MEGAWGVKEAVLAGKVQVQVQTAGGGEAVAPMVLAATPAVVTGPGRPYRPNASRPILKLTISLIDTYKQINKIYYEARARQREAEADGGSRGGMYNNGYDDQNYDYILHADEVFAGRYILKHKIGKVRPCCPRRPS